MQLLVPQTVALVTYLLYGIRRILWIDSMLEAASHIARVYASDPHINTCRMCVTYSQC